MALAPQVPEFTDDYCVPDGMAPADYCRTEVADYFAAGVRAISHWREITFDPAWAGSCEAVEGVLPSYTAEDFPLKVTCIPDAAYGDIETEGAEAYALQNDACEAGCSALSCASLQDDIASGPPLCSLEHTDPPVVGSGFLPPDCDCDTLPADCFDEGASTATSVCLPDEVPAGDDGADSGSGDGGGGGTRLKSAITVLSGNWDEVQVHGFTCQELDPNDVPIPPMGNPPPTGGIAPFAVDNGTSFVTGLLQTCPAPATDDVEASTFDTTLSELCRLMPLCEFSTDIALTLEAVEGTTTIATGTLTKLGDNITASESGAPLSVGDHTLDLCVTHTASSVEVCSSQPVRASAPLGSGVDGSGNFAGEMAPDFIPLAGKPEATQLTLSDNSVRRTSLPSGFSFPFYGTSVSKNVWVGANGGISTTSGSISASNVGLPAPPSANAPDIAVFWDDLDPGSGGGVYTWFDGTRFIVSWEDVPHGRDSSSSTTNGVSVQVHIYETGHIEFHYADTDVDDSAYDLGDSATIGIGNTAGSRAVEVSHDSRTLLLSGVEAVGFGQSSDGCMADSIVVPPEVGCAANDHYATVCTPTADTVFMPLPDVSACAASASGVAGEVIESGSKESTLAPLGTPISIDPNGKVDLDEGVHRVRWWPIDALGAQVGPSFTQIVFLRTWVHSQCGGSGRSMMLLTEGDDTHIATGPTSRALVALEGDDVLVTAAGDDFLGDGPGAGVCEAHDGNDLLVGEDGDDTLDAGPGDDGAWGGSGADLIHGGPGSDTLDGGDDDDIIFGGSEADEIWGGAGDDILEGEGGADILYPGSGVTAVYGGAGHDTIVILDACELTTGALLSGGAGADKLVLPPGLDLSAVVAAGVIVDGIESVDTSSELPTHRATCVGA